MFEEMMKAMSNLGSAPAHIGTTPRSGMIYELEGGAFLLLEGLAGDVSARQGFSGLLLEKRGPIVALTGRCVYTTSDLEQILARRAVRVYADANPYSGKLSHLSYGEIESIVSGRGRSSRYLIWSKSAVKEMTVDEISKALGYKVKVVGSEKADD